MSRMVIDRKGKSSDPSAKDIASTQYDFSGKVMRTEAKHMYGSTEYAPITITNRFTYDHAGRLLKTYQKNGTNSEALISEMVYNELGQVITKKLHSNIQTVDFKYNIRGWLESVNNPDNIGTDKFAYKLYYNNSVGQNLVNVQKYNGNISAIVWKTNSGANEAYNYTYDDLKRLKTANYFTYATSWTALEKYKLINVSYDLNGNIKTLKRNNDIGVGSLVDDLTYTYKSTAGNQLSNINDAEPNPTTEGYFFSDYESSTDEYFYDANGNMTEDKNKGISVAYNYLNLPEKVKWTADGRKIEWLYSANGAKLRNTIISENGTVFSIKDYVNGFEYKRGSASETPNLMQFPFSEGRVLVNNSNSFNYEYFMKDHLGNTRVSFNESAVVQQTNFYYPFGIRITGSVPGDENKYLYNGKELFDDNGLYWYHGVYPDMFLIGGARFGIYPASFSGNPQIGQWHTMDPADQYHSPYTYVGNDPTNYIDPSGMNGYKFEGDYLVEQIGFNFFSL